MIAMTLSFFVITAAFLVTGMDAFAIVNNNARSLSPPSQFSARPLHAIRCQDKYYQLEEMEDQEHCETEIFLHQDRTISFGQTDGPLFVEAKGMWMVSGDYFKMLIIRKYGTGQDSTDMGEFDYEVSRTYVGEMVMVGSAVGITGVMNTKEPYEFDNQEVGYFNMIDASDDREAYTDGYRSTGQDEVQPAALQEGGDAAPTEQQTKVETKKKLKKLLNMVKDKLQKKKETKKKNGKTKKAKAKAAKK